MGALPDLESMQRKPQVGAFSFISDFIYREYPWDWLVTF